MRIGLRLAALGVVLVTLVCWLFGDAHLGFSRTREMVTTRDPVTGLNEVHWEKHVVLGVDFLAGGVVLSGLLFGTSCFFKQH